MSREAAWIGTRDGRKFWPLDPNRADTHPDDLAWALGNKCRFTGYCDKFYSVAQHCVLIARKFRRKALRQWALLHDAAEAYLPDVATPIKWAFYARSPVSRHIVPFTELEDDILFRVLGQHSPHLSWPMPGPVKLADRRMVVTEKRDLFAGTSPAWPAYSDVKPYRERDRPLAGR